MKPILYYSNFCQHSRELLQYLSKTTYKDEIHFINIDTRYKDTNNKFQIVLNDSRTVPLPEIITSVPSLLLIHKNNMVINGEDIKSYYEKQEKQAQYQQYNSNQLSEPSAFDFGRGNLNFVHSDVYSFWDQTSDDLSAKGDGGLRQTYNYSTLNGGMETEITTPPENYVQNKQNKTGNNSMEQLIQERNQTI